MVGHSERINSVEYSPCGEYLVSGAWDKTFRLWRVETGICLFIIDEHQNGVYKVVFSERGDKLISSSEDRTIKVWEIKRELQ